MGLKIYMNDFLSYASTMSMVRTMGLLANYTGYFLSSVFKIPIVLGLPHSCSIEPTTRCNLQCPECPVGSNTLKREKGDLSLSNFKRILHSIYKYTSYLSLYLQGEPLLNGGIVDMIRIATDYKIYSCISTNGHFLDKTTSNELVKSGLKRIIISLDGVNQESYSKYRIKGDFNKVMDGIRNMVAAKKELKSKTPIIIIQFIVFKNNQGEINEFKRLGKELCIDKVDIKTAQHYDLSPKNSLITTNEKYSRYKKDNQGNWELKKHQNNRCKRIWTTAVITWNGAIIPCCYDKNASFPMGDLTQQDIKKIWKGEKFQIFRKKILSARSSIHICQNCDE